MTENNPKDGAAGNGSKRDIHALRFELKRMSYEFNVQAHQYASMTRTVDEALALVEDTVQRLDAEKAARDKDMLDQRATALGGAAAAAGKKAEFVFLVDGSRSMQMGPMDAVFDAVSFARKSSGGTNPVGLYGDSFRWISGDLADAAERQKIGATLGAHALLGPAVEEMEKLAAVNMLHKKSTHFVILGDGDLSGDGALLKATLEKLLTANKKVTFDIVAVSPAGAQSALKLAESIGASFPGRVAGHRVELEKRTYSSSDKPTLSAQVQLAVADMMLERLKKGAPKKKPAPKP